MHVQLLLRQIHNAIGCNTSFVHHRFQVICSGHSFVDVEIPGQLEQLRERLNGFGGPLKLRDRRQLMQKIDVSNLSILKIERNFSI